MSAYDRQVVGSINALTINARTMYKLNGQPLGTGDLANSAGFVLAGEIQADWLETDPNGARYVANKPSLAAIATSGSASDLATGTVPLFTLPQLPAPQISSGNFQVGSFAVSVAPTVDGSQNLGMGGLRWKTIFGTALAVNKSSVSAGAQLDVAGKAVVTGANPQLTLANASTAADGTAPAEVFFDRTATGSAQTGSVGFDATRGLFARVNGQDRLNVSTAGDLSISGRLTGLSVNDHQLGKFRISSFGYGSGGDYVGFGHGDLTGQNAPAVLARSDGTLFLNSGSGTGTRITFETGGSPLITIDASGGFQPFTDAAQALGGTARWGSLSVVDVTCTGTMYYGASKAPLAAIATSGSASDLVAGVAPLARIPGLPASRITSGTFLFDAGANVQFASNAVPSTNKGVSLGTSALQWNQAYVGNLAASGGVLSAGNITCNGNITAIDASGAISSGTGIVKATSFDTNFANTLHYFGSSCAGAGLTGSNISNLDSTVAQWRHRNSTANATPVTAAFCLQHSQAGATVLNALSGQAITLSNNNAPQVTVGLNAVLPSTTLAVGLGSSSQRFLDCYARNLNLSGSATMAQTLVVSLTTSGGVVARFNGPGGSGNVSSLDFSSFPDGSSPSWRWTQADAGNNLAVMKLQRTSGGGNSAAMVDVITHNTDSTVSFANQIRTPSIANLSNASYFDGKTSQLVNDRNYTVSGSNISQFTNDRNYTTQGSNVSQFTNDRNYTTQGSNVSQFNNDAGYARPGDDVSFHNVTATNNLFWNNLAYGVCGSDGKAIIMQPSAFAQAAVEIQFTNNTSAAPLWAYGIGSGAAAGSSNLGLWNNKVQQVYEVNLTSGLVTFRKGTSGTSDRRTKRDISPLLSGIEIVSKLQPVEFRWRSEEGALAKRHWGLIAQQVRDQVPRDTGLVTGGTTDDPMLGLAYHELTAPLIRAVQEQQALIGALQARVNALECASKNHPGS